MCITKLKTGIRKIVIARIYIGYGPEIWGIPDLVSIPKDEKTDSISQNHIGQIVVISFQKTLEKIVNRYLKKVVLVDYPLPSNQPV